MPKRKNSNAIDAASYLRIAFIVGLIALVIKAFLSANTLALIIAIVAFYIGLNIRQWLEENQNGT